MRPFGKQSNVMWKGGEVLVTEGNCNSPKKAKIVEEGAGKGKMQLGSRGHVKCKSVGIFMYRMMGKWRQGSLGAG
jgi:hypothetical protein